MKELIKEAEGLYLELSRITDSLVYARLHDDNDLLHGCRNELENFSQSVMQTLKCLIDRKDNIVELGEVWHTSNLYNFPTVYDYYEIVAITDGDIIHDVNSINDLHNWLRTNATLNIQVEWAYIKDLLPKGGEAWNTTK